MREGAFYFRLAIRVSISPASRGMSAIRSTGPSAVTSTSFSNRTAKPSWQQVNRRFDGHYPTRLHRLDGQADIVDIQSKRMPHAVHEILFERWVVGVLLPDLSHGQQTEFDQLFLRKLFGFLCQSLIFLAGAAIRRWIGEGRTPTCTAL